MSDDQTPQSQPPQKPEPGKASVRKFGGGPASSGRSFGSFDPCGDGCGHPEHQGFFTRNRNQPAEPGKPEMYGPPTPQPATPQSASAAPAAQAAHRTEKTFANAWKNLASDVRSRLVDGINPHAKPYEHVVNGVAHTHPVDPRIDRLGKVCIVGGAAVSLGVALHGVHNIARGMTGWEDKELGQSHAPSLTHVLIGAAETLAGAALLKRVLTGTMKVF